MTGGRPFRLARWSIAHPGRVLALLAAVLLAAAPGLVRLELRTDGHALVPPHDPAVHADADVRAHFGLRDPLVVVVETTHPDGVWNAATLRSVQWVSDALAAIEEIGPRGVMSLATEKRDRVYPGTLVFRPYLDPPPETPPLLRMLREDVAAAGILDGTLVGRDGSATAILAGVPAVGEGADRTALYRRIVDTVAPLAAASDRIRVVGAPAAEALLGMHLLEDLAHQLPLALLLIALVVWLSARRLACVGIAALEVGSCLVFTFGLMGWCGVPVYLPTAVLPVILTTVGVADEIHLFWHYQRALAAHPGEAPAAIVERTMRDLARPVVLVAVTTAFGFLSFDASAIAAVRAFGLFAAIGVVFCALFSLTAVPAVLTLLPPDRVRAARAVGSAVGSARWAAPLLARPRAALGALLLTTAVLGFGVKDLAVQDGWLDGFAPESGFRRDTDRVNAAFHGTHLLLLHLRFDPPADQPAPGPAPAAARGEAGGRGPLSSPHLLRAIGGLEDFVRRQPGVGGVLGPYTQMTTVAYLWLGRQPGTRRIPDDPARVDLVYERFAMGRGEHRRREVVDDARRRAVVTVFLKDANYRDTARLMRSIADYHRRELAPLGARLDFAGDVAVSQAMIPAIVGTQVRSLLLALPAAFLAVLLATRSPAAALQGLLPASFAVLWIFGLMGWLGIPLGVATSMFCAITLGIGVDYAIHVLERRRGHRAADDPQPTARALAESGPAIVFDALAVGLGFGILTLSQVPANARLGALVAAALGAACLLTLAGLGSLLALADGRRRASTAP